MKHLLSLAFLLSTCSLLSAADVVSVRFDRTERTQWGESLYLLGDRPELGNNDPTRAIRMLPGQNNAWSLTVELPAGANYTYRYLIRDNGAGALPSRQNARDVGSVVRATAPGTLRRRVRVRYYSGWPRVVLNHPGGQVWLSRTGAGRSSGESLWEGVVETDRLELEFTLGDGGQGVDRAPAGGNYRTGYGEFSLLEGRLYPGQIAPQGIETQGRVLRYNGFSSQILGNQRDLFIYLPRNYQNSDKRYPVIYAHDGQNLFGPDAMFGGWRLERAADEAIAAGQMAEVIVIGVANTRARMSEYMPEADGGEALKYGRFLTDELKPWVDRALRTKTGREDTALLGSSLGGITSLYLAWKRPDVFSKVGSLSGSYWLRGWVDNMGAKPNLPLKVWLDSGNEGGSSFDSLEHTLFVRDHLLRQGLVYGGQVKHFVGYGQRHNEAAWRSRVGLSLRFLFPAR
ncbi:MAG: hypothetical protein JKY65_20035 [Planctomycetes bacterium]|nr:hypothetical protein [Planctomycetota bacterium]